MSETQLKSLAGGWDAKPGMTFSAENEVIFDKLFELKEKLGSEALRRNASNPHHGNTYADTNAVLEKVEPILMEMKVHAITVSVPMGDALVLVETRLIHRESKQWVARGIAFEPARRDPQSMGSLETYGRRYNFIGLLNLRSEDDDGNAASGINGRQGGGKAARPPSEKALKLANDLAAEKGIEVPDDAKASATVCSAFIDDVKAGKLDGKGKSEQSSGSDRSVSKASDKPASQAQEVRKPTKAALEYATTLATEAGTQVPDDAKASAAACSKFIDEMKAKTKTTPAEQSSGQGDSSEASKGSGALNDALKYVKAAKLSELSRIRKHVEKHQVLTDEEKEKVVQAIEERQKAEDLQAAS